MATSFSFTKRALNTAMNDSDLVKEMPYSPSEAVVLGVAQRSGDDPTDLPTLYDVIDPEALDTLIQTSRSCTIEFEYAGYHVSVAGPYEISINEVIEDGHDR